MISSEASQQLQKDTRQPDPEPEIKDDQEGQEEERKRPTSNELDIVPLTSTNSSENTPFDYLPEPLPLPPFRLFVVGPSGCGKTNLILNIITRFLLTQDKRDSIFSKIFVFSPSATIDRSFQIFEQNPIFNRPDKTIIKNILDYEAIQEIINRPYDDEQILVYIDDFAGDKKALQDAVLHDLFFRSRHNNVSVIFTSQYYFQMPITERNNVNYLAMFQITKASDLSMVGRELATANFHDDLFPKAMKLATEGGKYNFLWIDRVKNKFYKNFKQEIEVKTTTSEEVRPKPVSFMNKPRISLGEDGRMSRVERNFSR